MQRIGKGFASACALVLGVGCAVGCGGIARVADSDGGPPSFAVDGGTAPPTEAGTTAPPTEAGTTTPPTEAGTTAVCPAGGPAGASPELLGPPPGIGDLLRGVGPGAGEGESFVVPRAGVVDQVVVQMFNPGGVTACRTRIYRWCDGQRVLVATTDTPASAFPSYSGGGWGTTSIAIDPPVPVAAGDRVDAVFSAVGGSGAKLVSDITTSDITPNARAVFPDGAPGIPDYQSYNWDFHAQIRLR